MQAISVRGIWKRYRYGRVGYGTLRQDLQSGWAKLFGKDDPNAAVDPSSGARQSRSGSESFWALEDVSFDVAPGEVVGIIGRNGAGKSTLLKIMSRITTPTKGTIRLAGRVASLLEVGTGFHPELTGRENVYLNGAILGMSRAEVSSKFDEIVAFSGLDHFVDTPVKRYSSGMYVRLAFSVAAHLEPEILLVDEVLAVGDVTFQRRCLGKMGEVARQGRTVLFVSHNLPTILALTSRSVLLESGALALDGSSSEVVDEYLRRSGEASAVPLSVRSDRVGTGAFRFEKLEFLDEFGNPVAAAMSGRPLSIVLTITGEGVKRPAQFSIGFRGSGDQRLFNVSTAFGPTESRGASTGTVTCEIPRLPLRAGQYTLNLHSEAPDHTIIDWVQNAAELRVEDGDFFGTGKLPPPGQGPLLVEHQWRVG